MKTRLRKPNWVSPDGSVRLYRADCRDVPVPATDLILTDPPYGIKHPCDFSTRQRDGLAKCVNWPDVHDDDKPFDPDWLLALDMPTVLWGANYYADKLPPSSGWLVWDKRRPDDLDQATCELAWTNRVKGVRRFVHLWNGCIKASERGQSFHPTQKPVALMSWCLSLRWLAGATHVFDPYMGAGPVGVACALLGKSYTGVEINLGYFKTAVKRIETALAQRRAG